MSTSNNKISTVFPEQVPFFIREEHPNTELFLKKYYEFLEVQNQTFREGRPVERIINHLRNIDIDNTDHDAASIYLYNKFMEDIPTSVVVNKEILLKNIKSFYRAKGTEEATKFLIYVLSGFRDVEYYYPKKDILKASDGKWYVEKTLRVSNTYIDAVSNTNLTGLEKFIGIRVVGETSNSSAIIESVNRSYSQGVLIDELSLSNIKGTFENAETVSGVFIENGEWKDISATVYGGIINSVTVDVPGRGYDIGDPVIVISSSGSGACVVVGAVSTGNIASIFVNNGGAGFQAGDLVLISGGGGSGANAQILAVNTDEMYHPNSYNIVAATIQLEQNTPINNAVYSNLVPAISNPYLEWIANSMLYFTYANTGPVSSIQINSAGNNYSTEPSIDIVANTMVRSLGILGRMSIVDGGLNYAANDEIEFENVPGGFGTGARAEVTAIDGSGTITEVKFKEVTGHLIGGSGYTQEFLPTANVVSGTGSGADIQVTAILGDGEALGSANSSFGAIERLTIVSGGSGYDTAPVLDLTASGDGTGNAYATLIRGVYEYPGYYLNDDGMLSSYNFLQDGSFYQLFSYVIRTNLSLSEYESFVKKLGHPAGMKLFGETVNHDYNTDDVVYTLDAASEINSTIILEKEYTKTSNTINIQYTAHTLVNGDSVYLEFLTDTSSPNGIINVVNSIYTITTNEVDSFEVTANNSNNTTGNVEVGIINAI